MARVAHTWASLSNACHYHAYELVPTAEELTGWIETVEEFAGCSQRVTGVSERYRLDIGG